MGTFTGEEEDDVSCADLHSTSNVRGCVFEGYMVSLLTLESNIVHQRFMEGLNGLR